MLEHSIAYAKAQSTDDQEIAFAELVEDIRTWDAQAEHRTGTEGDRITSQLLVDRLAAANVSAEIVSFPFVRRIPKKCYIEIAGERIDGLPLFDGGETSGILEGNIKRLGDVATIGAGEVYSAGGGPSRNLNSFRTQDQHQALVGIARSATPGVAMLNADAYKHPFGVPTLIVDGANESLLQRAIENQQNVKLNVSFEIEATTATNVEVRIAGSQSELAPLIVMTPKSSWWTSTAERCGGIAAWLWCIRESAKSTPARDITFTANTGHELGHVGLEYFLEQHPDLGTGARAWVHLGANFAASNSAIRVQYSDEELGTLISHCTERYDVPVAGSVDGNMRPGGEARNIFDAGGNYVSMLGSNSLFHHPDDRMANNVDLNLAQRTSNAVAEIVRSLSRA